MVNKTVVHLYIELNRKQCTVNNEIYILLSVFEKICLIQTVVVSNKNQMLYWLSLESSFKGSQYTQVVNTYRHWQCSGRMCKDLRHRHYRRKPNTAHSVARRMLSRHRTSALMVATSFWTLLTHYTHNVYTTQTTMDLTPVWPTNLVIRYTSPHPSLQHTANTVSFNVTYEYRFSGHFYIPTVLFFWGQGVKESMKCSSNSWTVVCPSFTLLMMLLLPGWPTMGLNRIRKKEKNVVALRCAELVLGWVTNCVRTCKMTRYVINDQDQLSLAITPWVGNRHTEYQQKLKSKQAQRVTH